LFTTTSTITTTSTTTTTAITFEILSVNIMLKGYQGEPSLAPSDAQHIFEPEQTKPQPLPFTCFVFLLLPSK
jgi:hypothetical protein